MGRALYGSLVAALIIGLLPTVSGARSIRPSSKPIMWCGTPGPGGTPGSGDVKTRLSPRERRQIKIEIAKQVGPSQRWDQIRIGNPINRNAAHPDVLGTQRIGGMAEVTVTGSKLAMRKLYSFEASKVIYPNAKFSVTTQLMEQTKGLKP